MRPEEWRRDRPPAADPRLHHPWILGVTVTCSGRSPARVAWARTHACAASHASGSPRTASRSPCVVASTPERGPCSLRRSPARRSTRLWSRASRSSRSSCTPPFSHVQASRRSSQTRCEQLSVRSTTRSRTSAASIRLSVSSRSCCSSHANMAASRQTASDSSFPSHTSCSPRWSVPLARLSLAQSTSSEIADSSCAQGRTYRLLGRPETIHTT